jgi:putative spermidine/putrescine transport system permease protein
MAIAQSESPPSTFGNRISTALYTRPSLMTLLLFALPLGFMLIVYVGSLVAMLINSFYHLNDFTGKVVQEFTLENYLALLKPANRAIILRTIIMAAGVTVTCAVLAFPLAYYIARYAGRRSKAILYVMVILPLWSSFLVRVYAWKLILAKEGILVWFANSLHMGWAIDALLQLPAIGGPSLSVSQMGMYISFVYVWLPYMILPIQASLERVPKSLVEASADLGAHPFNTFRTVILPLAMPGVIAGSIFTFSLTLGDFVVPSVLGNSAYFIGQAVLALQGTSGNIPMAAAFTMVPLVVMIFYLLIAKRLGAFEAL